VSKTFYCPLCGYEENWEGQRVVDVAEFPREREFWLCLQECLDNREFRKEYDRLHGTNLSMSGTPIDLEIDRATGRLELEFQGFAQFVRDTVYRTFKERFEVEQ
jgi:hypothetical protein